MPAGSQQQVKYMENYYNIFLPIIYIYTVKPDRETPPEQGPPPDKDRSKSPREKLLYIFPPNRDPLSTKTRDRLFSSQRPWFTCEQGPLSEIDISKSLC